MNKLKDIQIPVLPINFVKYKDINNLFFFSSDRWDIQLKNDLLIKLPSKNTKKTLDLVSDFLLENNNNSIKIVDARIQNQIILDD